MDESKTRLMEGSVHHNGETNWSPSSSLSHTPSSSHISTSATSSNSSSRLLPQSCRPARVWAKLVFCLRSRNSSWRRLALLLVAVVLIVVLYSVVEKKNHRSVFETLVRSQPPASVFRCGNTTHSVPHLHQKSNGDNMLREDPRVLLFTETQYSRMGKSIAEMLVANRIKYKMEVVGKSLPLLTNLSKGKYGAVVFENFERYLLMDQWNRELLDKYLQAYGVGLIGFMPSHEETQVGAKLRSFPLYVHTNMVLENASLNADNPVLRLTRAGDTVLGNLPGNHWTVFTPEHHTYQALELAMPSTDHYAKEKKEKLVTAVLDTGQYDGIQRVLFGSSLEFWLHRLLFLDGLSYLSRGRLSLSLDRYILVDIDDIFVGPKGRRMTVSDVEALLVSQKKLQGIVPGFHFNLGFSGKYYQKGYEEENEGDRRLLTHVDEFWWFGHMWGHTQPHKLATAEQLEATMQLNKQFARNYGIPTDSGYSVAPHHSGVYPIHEPLYEAWKRVWNIRVTSSEEYPHLRPARLRRGFIHRNIMVLPRQTCGLFTHTVFMDKYPGGRQVLDNSIQGGELFQTILNNPISIFMTHLSNYGNDRLALYTFESVIKFVKCWTNLNLLTAPPLQLGEKYFHMFPEERDPIWGEKKAIPRYVNFLAAKPCSIIRNHFLTPLKKSETPELKIKRFMYLLNTIDTDFHGPNNFTEKIYFIEFRFFQNVEKWFSGIFE
ncbi:unnamed protein product, partial [Meganyctiphanes norvegica]